MTAISGTALVGGFSTFPPDSTAMRYRYSMTNKQPSQMCVKQMRPSAGDAKARARGRSAALVAELIVCAEHGLGAEGGARDDAVDVEEEMGETSREVCQEAFGHGSKQPFDVVGQVLVVMFLPKPVSSLTVRRVPDVTHLVPQCTQEILHGLPIVLPELAQVFYEQLV